MTGYPWQNYFAIWKLESIFKDIFSRWRPGICYTDASQLCTKVHNDSRKETDCIWWYASCTEHALLKKNQHSFWAASLLRSFKKDIPKPELEFRFKPQPSSITKLKNQGKIIIEYIYSFLSICKRIIHSQKCHALTHNVTLHVTHRLRKHRVMH